MCATGTCDDCLRNVAILRGNDGEDGADGNSVLSGTGAPDNSLGNDGDFYVDKTAPFNFYFKTAGAWGYLGRLQGTDGNGFYISESTLISSADLLASQTSPVVITQTPPIGYGLIPVSITGALRYNSVAYSASQGLSVRYADTSHTFVGNWSAAFIQGSASSIGTCAISPPLSTPLGLGLVVMPSIGGVITTGNSPLLVRVIYYITTA